MHSSPVSVGKRPLYKTSESAGWSWPRLVPIHERQSRSSQESHSFASPPLPDRIEQEEPPTAMISTMISKLHTEGDTPPSPVLSPVLSAAGGSPTAGQPVAGTVEHQTYDRPRNSLLSLSDLDDERNRRFANSDSRAVEDLPNKQNSDAGHGFVEHLGEQSDSATENARIENVAKQGETAIAVDHEATSTHLPQSVWCTVRIC